jgi:hypothetical protein
LSKTIIRGVRRGKEHEEETFEPVEWPPRRRGTPAPRPERRERREPKEPSRRKREKTPA